MHTCEHCNRKYKNAATLSSHKYSNHRDMASKRNVVAIVNTPEEIPSRQNPRKVITSEDERRERADIERIMNLSGSSSDSSISLFDDDNFSTSTKIRSTKKRSRTPNSSDEEPPSKAARKHSLKRKRKKVKSDDSGEPKRKKKQSYIDMIKNHITLGKTIKM